MPTNPDERAAHLGVRVTDTRRLPAGILAWWQCERRTIWLRAGLTTRQRRATLMHEVIHVERGDETCVLDRLARRREHQVESAAARRLISTCDLAAALRRSWNIHELADVLTVDLAMMRQRLDLARRSPAETAYLNAVVADLIDQQIGGHDAVG